MPIPRPTLGVCSWSLLARTPAELAASAAEIGVDAVQLALDPVRVGQWFEGDVVRALARRGIAVASGMMSMAGEDYSTLASIRRTGGVRPDATWAQNWSAAQQNARLASRLGLGLVTFHAGFLPEGRRDPERGILVDRLRRIADLFAAEGVAIAFETGQESAATLLEVLRDLERPSCGINFDPANMILYGTGEPVAAFEALAPHIRQIHVKDALPPRRPGEWGQEVPVGSGAVDWRGCFAAYRGRGLGCDLMIEREAGEERAADMQCAVEFVRRELA